MTESIEEKKQDEPHAAASDDPVETSAKKTAPAREKPVLVLDYTDATPPEESVLSKFLSERKGPLIEVLEERFQKPADSTEPNHVEEPSSVSESTESQQGPEDPTPASASEGDASGEPSTSVDKVRSDGDEQPRLPVSHVVAPEMLESSPGYLRRKKEREERRHQEEVEAKKQAEIEAARLAEEEVEAAAKDEAAEAPTGLVEEVSGFYAPGILEKTASEAESEPQAETTADPESESESNTASDPEPAPSTGPEPLEFVDPDPEPGDKSLFNEDGDLDVAGRLRGYTKTVHAASLAARHKKVQVMGLSMVKTLIEDAVNETVQSLERDLDASEKQRLLEEAEESFNERLKSFQAEKAGLEEQTKHLQDQLGRAESLLEVERQKVVSAEQFTVSDAGLVELEKRLSRLLDRAVAKGGVDQHIEDEMRGVMARLLDDERENICEKAQDAQNEAILLLERKIGRLANSLEETSSERDHAQRRAHALEMAGGVAFKNVYDIGIGDEDPQKERKLKLMKALVEGNREVRQFMGDKEAGESQESSQPDSPVESNPESSNAE